VFTRTENRQPAARPRWEYLVLHAAGKTDIAGLTVISVDGQAEASSVRPGVAIHDALRVLGLARWELVTVVPSSADQAAYMYVFKRPIAQRTPAHLALVEQEGGDDV
jgi:hypothetical protein